MIYLDHNATTPLDREVKEVLCHIMDLFGNPSSAHDIGRSARVVIDDARQKVAQLIGGTPSEIVFTSGGTESNNLAILGTAERHRRGHFVTSVIEHPSVLKPLRWLQQRGFGVTYLPVGADGMVSPDEVRRAVKKDTILITVMQANNETGVLQPIREIGMIAREQGIAFHSDAAQGIGKMPVSVSDLRVDMLTVVPHKFYGPKGVGALYIREFGRGFPAGPGAGERDVSAEMARSKAPKPIIFGAGHERGMRPGTENTPCIAGFGKACEVAVNDLPLRFEYTRRLRDTLFELLGNELEIRLNGHESLRLPNTLNVSIKGIVSEDIISALRDRVALSSGSACHAGVRAPSPVLKAMGLPDDEALSSVRLSVGKDNSLEEIDEAAKIIIECVRKFRSQP